VKILFLLVGALFLTACGKTDNKVEMKTVVMEVPAVTPDPMIYKTPKDPKWKSF